MFCVTVDDSSALQYTHAPAKSYPDTLVRLLPDGVPTPANLEGSYAWWAFRCREDSTAKLSKEGAAKKPAGWIMGVTVIGRPDLCIDLIAHREEVDLDSVHRPYAMGFANSHYSGTGHGGTFSTAYRYPYILPIARVQK